eukprot:TRINITY_DN10090_c0_g1_i1.p1 TRINITY_DN10090_c0_g1~~TRINITY_DN10090_c0_g1_i1.p1  ORF type:complete len:208 (-),score=26.88 TRINITY_DN10090_c0_g1_i1:204-827(-)
MYAIRVQSAPAASTSAVKASVRNRMLSGVASVAAAVVIQVAGTVGPAEAGSVAFKAPYSEAVVSNPVHCEFAVDGMEVRPAKDGLVEGTGHFHLIIDGEPVPQGVTIQFDDTHLHYGKGQTAADIQLPSGKHQLMLQFANAVHQSYGPEFMTQMDVQVEQVHSEQVHSVHPRHLSVSTLERACNAVYQFWRDGYQPRDDFAITFLIA